MVCLGIICINTLHKRAKDDDDDDDNNNRMLKVNDGFITQWNLIVFLDQYS
jgi:hypothetical protein